MGFGTDIASLAGAPLVAPVMLRAMAGVHASSFFAGILQWRVLVTPPGASRWYPSCSSYTTWRVSYPTSSASRRATMPTSSHCARDHPSGQAFGQRGRMNTAGKLAGSSMLRLHGCLATCGNRRVTQLFGQQLLRCANPASALALWTLL